MKVQMRLAGGEFNPHAPYYLVPVGSRECVHVAGATKHSGIVRLYHRPGLLIAEVPPCGVALKIAAEKLILVGQAVALSGGCHVGAGKGSAGGASGTRAPCVTMVPAACCPDGSAAKKVTVIVSTSPYQ